METDCSDEKDYYLKVPNGETITACKNCGHPVKQYLKFLWRHVQVIDGAEHLSVLCIEASDCECTEPKG